MKIRGNVNILQGQRWYGIIWLINNPFGGRMKATGIVRKVDELGRIVLPIELRRTMNVDIKDPIEIYTEGELIILRKKVNQCSICLSEKSLKTFKSKLICINCINDIKET